MEYVIGPITGLPNEKTPEELQAELEQFQTAVDAGLIDNPDDDPPDVAEVGCNG